MTKPLEVVAKAIYDATVAKARREHAHVAKWDELPRYWREIHMTSAQAAIDAMTGITAQTELVGLVESPSSSVRDSDG